MTEVPNFIIYKGYKYYDFIALKLKKGIAMKMKKIIPFILLSTVMLSAQSGDEIFSKNCASCHTEIMGITNDGGYDNKYITSAPYIVDLVDKLKEKTASKEEFAAFIREYIQNPSKRESLYGKRAIKEFGLMPSLEGAMSDEEIILLVNYLYEEGYKAQEVVQEPKAVEKIDPREKLFTNNCASCHAVMIGTKVEVEGEHVAIYEAPYVEKVVQKLKVETKTKEGFVAFIKDYIDDPDKRKSLYGKRAIKEFGLMPSLKGALSDTESTQLAEYLYEKYGNE